MTHGAARRFDPAAEVLLGLAVASGESGDAGRLRHRLGEVDPAYLADAALPIDARRQAVRDPDVLVRRAVARNPRATVADLAELLSRPDPVVDRLVYRHATALPWMRREILTPGRHADPNALTMLWEEIRTCAEDPPDHPHFVGAAVVSGIPALIDHALRTCGSRLTRAEQLRGLLGLFADPNRLTRLLMEADFGGREHATGTATEPDAGAGPGPSATNGTGTVTGMGAGTGLEPEGGSDPGAGPLPATAPAHTTGTAMPAPDAPAEPANRPARDTDTDTGPTAIRTHDLTVAGRARRTPAEPNRGAGLGTDAASGAAETGPEPALIPVRPDVVAVAVRAPGTLGRSERRAARATGSDAAPAPTHPHDLATAGRTHRAPAEPDSGATADAEPDAGAPTAPAPTAIAARTPGAPAEGRAGTGFAADTAASPGRPDVVALAARALAAGQVGLLRDAVRVAEGSEGLVAGLRRGEPEAVWRRDIDWERVLAAHREASLPVAGATALAARADCPEHLVAELYRAHPTAVARVARPSATLLEAAVRLPGHPEATSIAAAAAAAGLVRARHAVLVSTVVRPARTAVAILAELPQPGPLGRLIHRHLGSSAARWATLRNTLSRHRGTFAELLAGIADGSIPAPAAAVPPALSRVCRFLLYAAPDSDLRALLPQLPDELLGDLLGKGPLPAPALDVALATEDPRVCAAVARNAGLDPRQLGRLAALDEPSVDAAVYRNQHTPLTLRRTIASGVPRTPGRTEPVPLDPGLRAELLDCRDPRRLSPLVVSGDPELVHAALSAFPSADARWFAFLRVWQRGGPDAVRRLVELLGGPGHSRQTATVLDALETPDGPGGLGPLRIDYQDPEALPRVFATTRGRNATRRLMATLVHEPYVYDLPRLVAGHRKTPYPPESIDELLRHEHAVGEHARLLRLAVVNRACGTGAGESDPEPVDRLAAVAFRRADADWVNDCVAHELLDPVRLVDTARPAAEVLRALPKLTPDTVAGPIRARLADLVRSRLAGHVEATVIGLGLLDSFAGTVAELITVAAQAAGARPGPAQRALDDAEIAEFARAQASSPPAGRDGEPAAPTLPTRRGRRHTPDRGCALAAAHLLRAMVPGAPLPTDPAVLAVLAQTPEADVPGLRHPDWLVAACQASPAELPRERLSRRDPVGFRATASASVRYRAGLVGPAELIATTPARALSAARPGEFSQLARAPLTRAVRALLAERLGHHPRRWLAALDLMDTDGNELPLPELLDRVPADPPTRPDPAPAMLSCAGSALLVYADVHVLRAVVPLLGPGSATALARDAERSRHVTDDLVEYALSLPDVGPALVLADGDPWAPRSRYVREQLLSRGDPELEDRLYGEVKRRGEVTERRRILARAADDPRPLSAALRARLLDPGVFSRYWADTLRVTVEAADADVVELALESLAGKLSLPDQLLAARNVLRFGGAPRLRAMIDRGLLGSGAAKVAAKALAAHEQAAEPDAGQAVLTARIDRELAPARLVAKLRTCERFADAERVLDRPYARDWALLAHEHAREPWPAGVRHALASRPDAPDEIVLAMLTDLYPAEAFAAARRGPRLARTVAAWVLPNGGTAEWHAELERLVAAGLLTGSDLVHEVGHADRVLRYLADARARVDTAPPVRAAVRAAHAEITALTVELLGTEDRSWQRLFAALTERDEHWRRAEGPAAGVAALLAHAAREPLGRVFGAPPGAG
ncbi:hypothetical protein [Embleya sp. AB8]|uniref:hypothetical protein n=1 Tax=Embleya sp. AB8 TaxID=3156304 RepID=UPI003C78C266